VQDFGEQNQTYKQLKASYIFHRTASVRMSRHPKNQVLTHARSGRQRIDQELERREQKWHQGKKIREDLTKACVNEIFTCEQKK
jgi:hypothetical protein